MKAVGPAGEMPWEFCSRVTHTPFGRKKPKRGQKHLLFRVLFPSQSAGNFLVCRFKGDWRSWWQRLIKHGNPTFSSGSPWAEKGWGWGRPWGQNPTSLPQHLSLAVLGSRQAGLFFWLSSATPMLSTAPRAGLLQGGWQGWGWVVFATRSKKSVTHLHLQQVLQRLTLVHSTLHRMETIIFAWECGLEAFIYLYFLNEPIWPQDRAPICVFVNI